MKIYITNEIEFYVYIYVLAFPVKLILDDSAFSKLIPVLPERRPKLTVFGSDFELFIEALASMTRKQFNKVYFQRCSFSLNYTFDSFHA